MSDDRDKLLKIMNSLESDYKSGKISREKYNYFRSKYEDKLNSIDAVEATRRIRSMQGKSTAPNNRKRSRKPTADKKKQEQDLVQKYIINPKKGDARYNKKKKSSMDGNTFKLIAVLVIAFTAGVAYGVFNFEFDTGVDTGVVAIVEDTAFPEIKAVVNTTVTNFTDTSNNTQVEDTSDDNTEEDVETTTDTRTTTTTETTTDTSTDSGSGSTGGGGSSDSGSGSTGGGGSSDSGSSSSSDSGGGSSSGEGGEE